MEYSILGKSGLKVSTLCFGSLTIGPLQRKLPLKEGLRVIDRAVDKGINFFDTADLYGTYPYLYQAVSKNKDLIIATKSYAYDKVTAEETLTRALKGIGRDYVDIFLLHEQEGPYTLKGHAEALNFFIDQKKRGKIRAIGISTHHIQAVKAASLMEEVDIIHPILNYRGIGIVDGTRTMMEESIKSAYLKGKGIYIMKSLGGGHLIKNIQEAFNYALDFPYAHAIAVGMQRTEEVDLNVDFFHKRLLPEGLQVSLNLYKRELLIQDWCQSCGECTHKCPQGALLLHTDGKVQVDKTKCVFCGYCGAICKEMAIKVI